MAQQPSKRVRRYRVETYKGFTKDLERLPYRDQQRVAAAIEALATEPRPQGVKKLSGQYDRWRIRIGDYRVVYTIFDNRLMVLLVKLSHRRDVYE